ncbi:hypothetical protein FKM82_024580 [Ascaphus truei]
MYLVGVYNKMLYCVCMPCDFKVIFVTPLRCRPLWWRRDRLRADVRCVIDVAHQINPRRIIVQWTPHNSARSITSLWHSCCP